MSKSNIPYCDYSWNTVIGCSKIASGCRFCWSEQLHNQRHTAWWDHRWPTAPRQYHKEFRIIQLRPDRLDEPLHWRKPRVIFVNSMSDTFHKDVPDEFIDKMFATMAMCPQHKFLLFTKRWARVAEYLRTDHYETLPNVHLYFSASTQAEVDEAWKYLEPLPVAIKGFSLEPLLEPIEVPGGDVAIIGCESGPQRRYISWSEIRMTDCSCIEKGIKRYIKQLEIDGKVRTDMSKFPPDLRVRQM